MFYFIKRLFVHKLVLDIRDSLLYGDNEDIEIHDTFLAYKSFIIFFSTGRVFVNKVLKFKLNKISRTYLIKIMDDHVIRKNILNEIFVKDNSKIDRQNIVSTSIAHVLRLSYTNPDLRSYFYDKIKIKYIDNLIRDGILSIAEHHDYNTGETTIQLGQNTKYNENRNYNIP